MSQRTARIVALSLVLLFLLLALLPLAGCSSDDAGELPKATVTAPVSTTTATGVRPEDAARQGACAVEQRTIETAAELYRASYDNVPPSMQALVDAGLLRNLPEDFTITNGEPVGTGPCA